MGLTLEYLSKLDKNKRTEETLLEYIKCKNDFQYMIENYFTVNEPTLSIRVPFVLYPHQIQALKDFKESRYNLTMKSRQMGFTTISQAYVACFMATNKNKEISALATKLKTSRKFLKGVKDFLNDARKRAPWLIPDYADDDNGKDSFSLKNKSHISAESNNEEACRGETLDILIIDEVATITKMEEIWSAAGITLTRSKGSCIGISTPKGQSGWYFDRYTNAEEEGWNIINAHWSLHPLFSKGMYAYIAAGKENDLKEIIDIYGIKPKSRFKYQNGFLVFFNSDWPDVTHPSDLAKYKTKETYPYILDGKLRSPWYDGESKKLGKEKTKCELDCSFAGSGGEVLDTELIKKIDLKAKLFKQINQKGKDFWKSYKQYIQYDETHDYILVADVASGDGSDYSAFVVVDITAMEVVATYKEYVATHIYAKVIAQVGKMFGNCQVVVEHNNQGIAVLNELKIHIQYSNLYYSQLKKTDPTLKEKVKKIGFWQSGETRSLGGEKLEEILEKDMLKIYGSEIPSELYTWVWKDGRRDHAPGKHDDLIMALTMAMYVIFYVNIQKETQKQKILEQRKNLKVIRNQFYSDDSKFDWVQNMDER